MNLIKNRLYLFWKIGKIACEKQKYYDNVVEKLSDYYSYYFGDSNYFTRESIHMMKKFYINFPIYYKELNNISWNQYRLLLSLSNKNEMYFYFRISLLFFSDYQETLDFINNNYYVRI